jgi:hypothetical protein
MQYLNKMYNYLFSSTILSDLAEWSLKNGLTAAFNEKEKINVVSNGAMKEISKVLRKDDLQIKLDVLRDRKMKIEFHLTHPEAVSKVYERNRLDVRLQREELDSAFSLNEIGYRDYLSETKYFEGVLKNIKSLENFDPQRVITAVNEIKKQINELSLSFELNEMSAEECESKKNLLEAQLKHVEATSLESKLKSVISKIQDLQSEIINCESKSN